MTGWGIFFLVLLLVFVFWPYISKWLARKAQKKLHDYFLRSMGLQPEKETRKQRKQREQRQREYEGQQAQRRREYSRQQRNKEPLIPKEYAEDVEFVETKEFSSSSSTIESNDKYTIYHESQISDVEWVEIKTKPKK